jgi:hypothetical protein
MAGLDPHDDTSADHEQFAQASDVDGVDAAG